jgi:outer membrane receptor protein involved in Fe transport
VTSAGGLTAKFKGRFESGVRYHYLASRPANEENTVRTKAYSVIEASANYMKGPYKVGIVIENLFNVKWNEAQFDTVSKLSLETQAKEELHFTPGTPFTSKLVLSYSF